MNLLTILFGVAAIAFGSYTSYCRFKAPERLQKLQAMRVQFGKGMGTAVHATAYSVLPMLFGAGLVLTGFKGASLF
ncbi:hypothetical protein [Rhodopirellula bahusiensis]|uniref:hypothetical protein n=1 Tax=Rhodopirellula bahusiensis TaxID=2014065 RepID=UPI003264CB64